MSTMDKISRPTVVTGPTEEPITLGQAKKHIEIASENRHHDAAIETWIQAAREQWEKDTDTAVLTQTLSVTAPYFYDCMRLPRRPIQSITSITYYDGDNAQQTLDTSIYQLDIPGRKIRLGYLQNWPTAALRWDAITITYVAGHSAVSAVPAIAKQAMLLLIGGWFEERGEMMKGTVEHDAYMRLVHRYMRSSYP